jgi:hypothetical protein
MRASLSRWFRHEKESYCRPSSANQGIDASEVADQSSYYRRHTIAIPSENKRCIAGARVRTCRPARAEWLCCFFELSAPDVFPPELLPPEDLPLPPGIVYGGRFEY